MSDGFLTSLRDAIRTVPDFPIEGIMFRDITPVLSDPGLMSGIIDRFAEDMEGRGWRQMRSSVPRPGDSSSAHFWPPVSGLVSFQSESRASYPTTPTQWNMTLSTAPTH